MPAVRWWTLAATVGLSVAMIVPAPEALGQVRALLGARPALPLVATAPATIVAADSRRGAKRMPVARCSKNHRVELLPRPKWIRHKVVPRESLAQIAHRYGVAPWELKQWNGIELETKRVRTGTRLRVKATRIPPPRQKVEYTIRRGDTWARVAQMHGVESWDLRSYNWPYRRKMRTGNMLKVWVDPVLFDWIHAADPAGAKTGAHALRRGAAGVGPPDGGKLLNGVQIPEGRGYALRYPDSAFGTTHAVEQVLQAMAAFTTTSAYKGMIRFGAMSRIKGGKLGTHKSHQTGRDLDVRLPRRSGVPKYVTLKLSRVDWRATWELVKAWAQTDVMVVFLEYRAQKRLYRAAKEAGASDAELQELLQYPRGPFARRGLVRHVDGHDKHMHVRFGCGPCEIECVVNVGEEPPGT